MFIQPLVEDFLLTAPVRNFSAPGFGDNPILKTDTRAMTVTTALFLYGGISYLPERHHHPPPEVDI